MDKREKLAELLSKAPVKGNEQGFLDCEVVADYLLANGVTMGGVAELISSSKIGLDWYTRIPIYYCSHCGWYIESRSKLPERPRDLEFCPKCGFMFLPQKEVNDGDDLDAGHG